MTLRMYLLRMSWPALLAMTAGAAVAQDAAPPPIANQEERSPTTASTTPTEQASDTLAPAAFSLSNLALLRLRGKSVTLGLAYSQGTLKTSSSGARAQLTDNGSPSPVLTFNSGERSLASWPMRVGNIIIGWDYSIAANYFSTRYQLVDSALRGTDVGTKVSGGYLGAAPTLFLKLGPLLPGKDIYWKVGFGPGLGIFTYSGNVLVNTSEGSQIDRVGGHSAKIALYSASNWQLQLGHWLIEFQGKYLLPASSPRTTFESYGLGLAYRLDF